MARSVLGLCILTIEFLGYVWWAFNGEVRYHGNALSPNVIGEGRCRRVWFNGDRAGTAILNRFPYLHIVGLKMEGLGAV